MAQLCQLRVIVAETHDQSDFFNRLLVAGSPFPQCVLKAGDVRDLSIRRRQQVGRQGLQAAQDDVPVAVDESRQERLALQDLGAALAALPAEAAAEEIQTQVYEVGKRHDFADLKSWFRALYEILLGQTQGPRMGSFFALFGLPESVSLIRRALAGEDLGA